MTLIAYIVIAWALVSAAATILWIGLHHLVWWQQRRRSESISNRASRPVSNQANRALPTSNVTYQVRPRDEGTAPADRAAIPEPGEKHPYPRLIT